MTKRLFVPIVIILLALLTGIFAWSTTGSFVRQGLTFIFILLCPGLALTGLFHLADLLSEFVLGVALSLALSILLAELLVFTHLWSPYIGLFVLIIISLAGSSLQLKNAFQLATEESE